MPTFLPASSFCLAWLRRGGALLGGALALGVAPLAAQTVTSYDLFELQFFTQTSEAQPTSASDNVFNARIFFNSSISGATATVTTPLEASLDLGSSGSPLQYRASFGSLSALEERFPKGDYNFSLQAETLSPMSQSGTLNLPSSFFAQSVPYFTHWSSLQNVDPTQGITLEWNAFCTNGSAPSSYIFLVVHDSNTDSDVLNTSFEGSGQTSCVLDPNTLTLGHSYTATVYFSERQSGASWSEGAGGLVAFDLATTMTITAIPEPASYAGILGVLALSVCRARKIRRPTRG